MMALRPPGPDLDDLIGVLRSGCAVHPEIRESYLYRSYETSGSVPVDDVPDDAWELTLLFVFAAGTSKERSVEIFNAVGAAMHAAAERGEMIERGIKVLVAPIGDPSVRNLARIAAPIVVSDAQLTGGFVTAARVLVGRPTRQPPRELVEAVRRICARDEAVVEATYQQVAFLDGDGRPQLAIGLRIRPGTSEDHARALMRALGAALTPERWGYDGINILIEATDSSREHRTTIFQRS